MLKHFKAINVQEPKDRGAPPAGALSILGPAVQQRAWVLVFASTQPRASLDCPLCCLRSSMGQGPRAHLGGQRPVDLPDQPGKSAAVHGLGKSVSCIRSLFQVQRAQELPAKVRREMMPQTPFHLPPVWAQAEHQKTTTALSSRLLVSLGGGARQERPQWPHQREDGVRTGGCVPGGGSLRRGLGAPAPPSPPTS